MPARTKFLTVLSLFVVLLVSTGFTGGATRSVEVDDFRNRAFANPSKVVDVAFGVSGVLGSLSVDRGAVVAAGAEIGRLDSRVEAVDLEIATARATSPAAIDRARAALELAELQLADAEQLRVSDIIPEEQLDERITQADLARATLVEAKYEQRIAQLQLDRAREVIERRRVVSPVSGVVTEVFFEVGERIEATEDSALARVAVVDPLRAEFLFDVADLGIYTEGEEVVLRFFAPSAPTGVTGTVTVVDRVVDAASQTFRVRVEIANPDRTIPAGLECEIVRDSQ